MTYSLVNANTVATITSGTTVTPTCTSTAAGNLLVLGLSGESGLTITFTPPAGWQKAISYHPASSNDYVDIWYYPNNPGGITSVAVTTGNAGTSISAQIMEFSDSAGSNTSPLDKTGSNQVTSGTTVAVSTSSTIAAAHELAVAVFACHYTSATKVTLAAGTGFTEAGNYGNAIKQTDHAAFDYELDTGASSGITVTDTEADGGVTVTDFAGAIATFKINTGTSQNVTGVAAAVTAAGGVGTPSGAANVTGVAAPVAAAGGTGTAFGTIGGVAAPVAAAGGSRRDHGCWRGGHAGSHPARHRSGCCCHRGGRCRHSSWIGQCHWRGRCGHSGWRCRNCL